MKSGGIPGLLAEFDDPTSLVAATEGAHREGYRSMDAYSPFPIEELHEALGARHTRLPLIVLIGGLFGCIGGGQRLVSDVRVRVFLALGGVRHAGGPAVPPRPPA